MPTFFLVGIDDVEQIVPMIMQQVVKVDLAGATETEKSDAGRRIILTRRHHFRSADYVSRFTFIWV